MHPKNGLLHQSSGTELKKVQNINSASWPVTDEDLMGVCCSDVLCVPSALQLLRSLHFHITSSNANAPTQKVSWSLASVLARLRSAVTVNKCLLHLFLTEAFCIPHPLQNKGHCKSVQQCRAVHTLSVSLVMHAF